MRHIFIVEIEIYDNCWDYKKGDILQIPVYTNNSRNAMMKVENEYWGSEYPSYGIKSVNRCDNDLFKPLIPFDN